ncbi:uncharacterized protein LOC114269200 isoform X2 [Camellia sinensis]|uniref:uncharacterized protein LOC114269200 isoform X2 n=1 Tax=Camellia sinensis TaxID=4442 RepID=UPI0010367495|nr:uncharacterized protein LOC114269200 isoform X2 [Camellia sinensis]
MNGNVLVSLISLHVSSDGFYVFFLRTLQKCLEVRGEIHEAHEIVLQSSSVLDFLSREVGEFLSGSLAGVVTKAVLAPFETIRYGYNRRWSEDEKGMGNNFTRTQIRAHKKRRLSFLPQACFALVTTRNSTLTNFYQEVIEAARERFTREISFQSKDKDISLAKSPGLLAAFLVWLSAATL